MSITVNLPQTDLVGVTDFAVTVLDTSDTSDDGTTVSSDSLVVISGATDSSFTETNYFEIHLPASPDSGDIIRFKNLATGDNADNIQITSALIQSEANETIELDHQVDFFLIYVNSDIGWVVIG